MLGIDQAIRSTGLTLLTLDGEVVSQCVLNIPMKLPIIDGIDVVMDMAKAIKDFVQGYHIALTCIELPTFSSDSMRSKQLNMLFGSILTEIKTPYIVGNATSVKKFATGLGRHTKEDKKVVMQKAWEQSHPSSYNTALAYLQSKFTKTVVTRAIGDLADSYWLAKYGLSKLDAYQKQSNPTIQVNLIV